MYRSSLQETHIIRIDQQGTEIFMSLGWLHSRRHPTTQARCLKEGCSGVHSHQTEKSWSFIKDGLLLGSLSSDSISYGGLPSGSIIFLFFFLGGESSIK